MQLFCIRFFLHFRYILSIENAEDLEEYMLELLDGSDPLVHKFIHELLEKWDPPEKGNQRIAEVMRRLVQ